jgi:circadian clock protein KaiC
LLKSSREHFSSCWRGAKESVTVGIDFPRSGIMASPSSTGGLPARSATGIAGLDDVLGGGFTPNRVYLVEGKPGSGKTTLALQYLFEGRRIGEAGVYVTLSETRAELAAVAASHGWTLDGLEIVELVASEDELEPENQSSMFMPGEIELGVTTKAILAQIDRVKPRRVAIDSLSELRLLAQNSLRYRRQILALKQFFIGREATVLLLDDKTSEANDLQLQSIAHGVLSLEELSAEYGAERRRLRITKLRGQTFRGGYHDFHIGHGGIEVFPRLVAAEHAIPHDRGLVKGSVKELDDLLGGGLHAGSSVLLIGPAGSGKSTIAASYAFAAAARGERSAVFMFDERIETLIRRTGNLNIDLQPAVRSGLVSIQSVDPAELTPGEFAHSVRRAVDGTDGGPGVKIVVIDSLNGYLHAMPEEKFLGAQLHELLTYLGHKGVVTFLVMAQLGMLGSMQSPVDTTYLADVVVLFRFFEAEGEIRRAISVTKNRSGRHERTIREFQMDGGIQIGAALAGFRGVLTGVPNYVGKIDALMGPRND